VVVPEGMTLHLQVLNVVVNKMFKHHPKQLYSEGLLTRDHALTSAGRIVNPSVTLFFSVDHKVLAPKMIGKGYKECCTSNAMDGTDDYMFGMTVRIGMLGVSTTKMKALTVKMETVTLTSKGGQNLTCFVN
jgi:hypothetical protein